MTTPVQRTRRRIRLLGLAFSVVVFLLLAVFAWGWSRLRASLPQLDGRVALPGLAGEVVVERDAQGVPTLRATARTDVSRVLGYLHGQDRFFQMDLSRRRAAGELAELFGRLALPLDRGARLHELRSRARQVVEQLPADQRRHLELYAEGVNAGLGSLGAKPWEYLALRSDPHPWKAEDSVLCLYAMALDLQDEEGVYERTLMTLRDELGEAALAFFAPAVGPEDAALDGTTRPLPAIPSARVLDLRARPASPPASAAGGGSASKEQPALLALFSTQDPEFRRGSNSFGVTGAVAGGGSLLQNDMHLNYSVPNTWYRVRIQYPDTKVGTESPVSRDLVGVTLPGAPALVVGSNGQVAWAFTNSYTDTGDLVLVQTDPIAPELMYTLGNRTVDFEIRRQTIGIKGEEPETFESRWTAWGPIVGQTDNGRLLAYRWIMHDPAAANFSLLELEHVAGIEEAIVVAHRAGIPAQNFLVGDRAGQLAWTIAGKLPERLGHEGRLPISWAYGDRGWKGLVPPERMPVVRAAPGSYLWSANQRMAGGEMFGVLGDGGYEAVARAAHVRDRLGELVGKKGGGPLPPSDLLALALDDEARYLNRWYERMKRVVTPAWAAGNKEREQMRRALERWEGRASVESVSYRLVRTWRQNVANRVLAPVFARCVEAWPDFNFRKLPYEHPLWKLLEEQPAHLLSSQYADWTALLQAAADDVLAELRALKTPVDRATWGEYNRMQMQHPFSAVFPGWLARHLNMPEIPMPGDLNVPRVSTPIAAASERLVVSPGRESEGLFHMPGGQSGHPLSPFYRAGHQAWVRGEATPLLPGEAVHTLVLQP